IATAAKMVRVSGTEGVCIIQTCRMPAASAATMVETAVDAFAPFTTSPTRSRVGFEDRKSTRLNSSHVSISYAVFCLKKKNHIHLHRIASLDHLIVDGEPRGAVDKVA